MKFPLRHGRLRATSMAFFLLNLLWSICNWQNTCHNDIQFSDSHTGDTTSTTSLTNKKTELLVDIVQRLANADKVIVLVYVSPDARDIALNLHEVSLQRLGITNVLFVSAYNNTCHKLKEEGLQCFVYATPHEAQLHATIMLELLSSGYSVLYIDTDILFLTMPFKHIDCTTCDIAVMDEDWGDDVSFIYARPTVKSKMLYENMYDRMLNTHIQKQTKHLKESLESINEIYVMRLPSSRFRPGITYFEFSGHMFAGDRAVDKECVLFRNNWMFTTPAKIYRLREHMFWLHERDGYYSSETRKYLMYNNPVKFKNINVTMEMEKKALKNALAIGCILNRTVILPAFSCADFHGQCPLNSFYKISKLDAVFGNMYREHVFLGHPKVPDSVKENMSVEYLILGDDKTVPRVKQSQSTKALTPRDVTKGATSDEITTWFAGVQESILNFHSLYAGYHKFVDLEKNKKFEEQLKKGLQTSNYRQH